MQNIQHAPAGVSGKRYRGSFDVLTDIKIRHAPVNQKTAENGDDDLLNRNPDGIRFVAFLSCNRSSESAECAQ